MSFQQGFTEELLKEAKKKKSRAAIYAGLGAASVGAGAMLHPKARKAVWSVFKSKKSQPMKMLGQR